MDFACEVWMLGKLSGPAVNNVATSKIAIFPCKGGDESTVVEHELGRFVQVGFDDIAESRSVSR